MLFPPCGPEDLGGREVFLAPVGSGCCPNFRTTVAIRPPQQQFDDIHLLEQHPAESARLRPLGSPGGQGMTGKSISLFQHLFPGGRPEESLRRGGGCLGGTALHCLACRSPGRAPNGPPGLAAGGEALFVAKGGGCCPRQLCSLLPPSLLLHRDQAQLFFVSLLHLLFVSSAYWTVFWLILCFFFAGGERRT